MKFIWWAVLIGIGCLCYALVVVDDVGQKPRWRHVAMLRLIRPSIILNTFDPPPDLRAQKDDSYEPVVDTKGFQETDCLEAKGSRFTHPKLAGSCTRNAWLSASTRLD